MSGAVYTLMRPDYAVITDWVKPDSRILDLACGDGTLLHTLAQEKNVAGYGVEIDDQCIPLCIRNGINIIQSNLNQGLSEFDDNSFDYVVLSLTLQSMNEPHELLQEMMRVGTEGIVTFPNFGHWHARLQLARGKMPVTSNLPHRWYNTPNIHLCTLRDFEDMCHDLGIDILERRTIDHGKNPGLLLRLWPNLFGKIALYRFRRKKPKV